MEQQVTDLFNRTSGTEFYNYSGEMSCVQTRLAVPETRIFAFITESPTGYYGTVYIVKENTWSAVCTYRLDKGVRIAMIDIKVTSRHQDLSQETVL